MARCTTTTLSPYVPNSDSPWNRKRILHLYRRISFGAHVGTIDDQLNKAPGDLVDELIDEAVNKPDLPVPEWAEWGYSVYKSKGLEDRIFEDSISLGFEWVRDMMTEGFRARVRKFWLNHFVTELEQFFCSSTLYKYLDVLHRNSLGNFKTFVYEIGISPAMLIYLNGDENNKYEPNENYARELFELFTLGVDQGYVQEDIVQAARALTGWQVYDCNTTVFNANLFDNADDKVIFGIQSNFTYGSLIDHLFDSKAFEISRFICRKIYIAFVSDDVEEAIVEEMATLLRNSNFELEPVFRALFKSAHFFDESNIGVKVKSPYQLTLGFLNEFGARINDDVSQHIYWISSSIGQDLLNPPDVAGWQGNRSWVDSSTLAIRWTLVDAYSWFVFNNYRESLRALAKRTSGDSNDVEQVVLSVVEYFLPNGLQLDEHYNSAVNAFKADVPSNYFDDGSWNLDWDTVPYQMTLLMQHLGRQPEYQLY